VVGFCLSRGWCETEKKRGRDVSEAKVNNRKRGPPKSREQPSFHLRQSFSLDQTAVAHVILGSTWVVKSGNTEPNVLIMQS
jgi:hypothetical protein